MRTAWAPLLAIVLGACSSAGGGGGTGGTGTTTTAGTGGTTGTTTTSATTSTTTATGDGGGDTWTNYAQGFFAMYCVECHSASDPTGRDYDKLADVMKDAALIRCGVAPVVETGCTASSPAPKQFPISNSTGTNPKPSDAERLRIVAWIDAGLPQ